MAAAATPKVLGQDFTNLILHTKTRVQTRHGFLKDHTNIFADNSPALLIV